MHILYTINNNNTTYFFMPSYTKLIQQQTKGVATSFIADASNVFVSRLFGGNAGKSGNFTGTLDPRGPVGPTSRLETVIDSQYSSNKISAKIAAGEFEKLSGRASQRDTRSPWTTSGTASTVAVEKDWRVRINVGSTLEEKFFKGDTVLNPLKETRGVVFPYVPQLTVTNTATYVPTTITHANFQHYTYSNSDIAAIQINGDFTVQNQEEGRYVYAVIHFFRTVTKMFFGTGGSDPTPFATPGTPPPILFLSAHGALFKKVPVVLTNFTSTFPSDVNYLPVTLVKGSTPVQVPTMMTLSVTLQPVFNRKQAQTFDLSKFATGNLLDKGYI